MGPVGRHVTGRAAQGSSKDLGIRSQPQLEGPWEFLHLSVPQFSTSKWLRGLNDCLQRPENSAWLVQEGLWERAC